jgi:hypothetical protein
MVLLLMLLHAGQTSAADLSSLASCATKVFSEINQSHAWSGKAPAGCVARVTVEKWVDGAQVTTWITEQREERWVRTSFAVLMGYTEIADTKVLKKVNNEILSRARHLGRCLDSLIKVNDPQDCRYKATKDYYVGEKTGTEERWLIWLDDDGRRSVVEYLFGDTVATPSPPADLYTGELLPPGTDLHILLR